MSRRSQLQPNPNVAEMNTRKQKLLDLSKPINPNALNGIKIANIGMLAPAGYSLIFVTSPEGNLSPVLIKTGTLPPTYSVEDYDRIQQARGIVGGEDNALSRASVLREVTDVITCRLADDKKTPKLKPEAQSEVLRLKACVEKLEKNRAFLFKAQASPYKDLLSRHLVAAITAVNTYLMNTCLTSASEDKLQKCLLTAGCPRWVFSKFSEYEEPELAKRPSLSFYFPKKISKGFQVFGSELKNLDMFGPLKVMVEPLVTVTTCNPLGDLEDSTKLYVVPIDILSRIDDIESIPTVPRTTHKAVLISIALIEMIAANYQPLLMKESTLLEHIKVFNKATVPLEPFKKSDTDPRALKVQYLEHIKNQVPNGVAAVADVWKSFGLPDELKALDFFPSTSMPAEKQPVNFFRPITKIGTSEQDARAVTEKDIIEKLPNLMPPKKRLRGGLQQQPLTEAARKFVAQLQQAVKSGSVHEEFVTNVSTFLRGFYLPAMMDLAVQVLAATIQSREIIPEVDNPPDGGWETEDIPGL